MTILEALKERNLEEFARLLETMEDVNQLDEHGWTLLHWVAGQGNVKLIKLLVAKGADVFRRGRDNRTAYMVALAAGHLDAVKCLSEQEEKNGGDAELASSRQGDRRCYCKAYPLKALREFAGWKGSSPVAEAGSQQKVPQESQAEQVVDDEVVFIHQDHSVTRSVINGQDVIFETTSPEWRAFCAEKLGFKVPTDIDLLTAE